MIGDIAERSHAETPLGVGILVRERLDFEVTSDSNDGKSTFPVHPVPIYLAPAIDFELIWTDYKTGLMLLHSYTLHTWHLHPPSKRRQIWRCFDMETIATRRLCCIRVYSFFLPFPILPSLDLIIFILRLLYSDIAAKGHGVKPDPSIVQCVHKSLVQKAVVLSKEYLWGSKNSSAATHASVWMMTDLQGVILPTFTATKARKGKLFWHYDSPKYDVFCLNV